MRILLAVLLAMASLSAAADDRADYNRRAAARDMAAFHQLDLNGDGRLAREEVQGDLDFGPRFDAIDINRDGIVTPEEMQRYIEQTYQVRASG